MGGTSKAKKHKHKDKHKHVKHLDKKKKAAKYVK